MAPGNIKVVQYGAAIIPFQPWGFQSILGIDLLIDIGGRSGPGQNGSLGALGLSISSGA